VTGLRETQRSLEKLGVSVADLKQAMTNVSDKSVSEAKSLVPVRSGALQASIKGSKAKAKATIRMGTKAKTYYASFIEWGTALMTAREIITRTVMRNKGYAVQQIEKEVTELIRKYDLK
jgi:HK97 gp10 family phage protein